MLRIGKCKHQIGFLITCTATFLSFSASSLAQNITTDGTTGSAQTLNGPQYNIPQSLGTKTDKNLFHSFGKFNLDAGESAVFQSGADISNIFSRVTGGTPSSINGLISTSSNSVNLFFINPSGIIFGENASLDVGGSFVATTLERLVWSDGSQFSATKPEGKNSLLKITGEPTGFVSKLMQPRPVTIRGSRLQASGGNNLLFLGGNVNLDRSSLTLSGSQGGKIELAGISEPETVGLEFSGNKVGLSFSENIEFADISLSNGSGIAAFAKDGGEIRINARNLDILNGSQIVALNINGININASDTVRIDGVNSNGSVSGVGNVALEEFAGKGGDININTGSLLLTNGGSLSTKNAGQGDGSSINIAARDRVTIDSLGDNNIASVINTVVQSEAEGKGGDININTGSLLVNNRGFLNSDTGGKGNGGSINITARDTVTMDSLGNKNTGSIINTFVQSEAEGKGGDININTGSLSVNNGSLLNSNIAGKGDGGSINITARDTVVIDGLGNNNLAGTISTLVQPDAEGKGGDININTGFLSVTNGGFLTAGTDGQGSAGSINIDARYTVNVDATNKRSNSVIGTLVVQPEGEGKGGNIDINTSVLRITNGGSVIALTNGLGDAGSININANDSVVIDGQGIIFPNTIESPILTSDISTSTSGQGKAGDINIKTGLFKGLNGGNINAFTVGDGDAGNIIIDVENSVIFDGEDSRGISSGASSNTGIGTLSNGGDISISTSLLSLTNGAQLNTSIRGKGDAGNITINAHDRINLVSSQVASHVETTGEGKAGNISIFTSFLLVNNGTQLNSSTFGKGDAGNININALDGVVFDGEDKNGSNSGVFTSVAIDALGNAGNININTASLSVSNGAQLSSSTFGKGDGGNITINARNNITIDGEGEDRFPSGILSNVQEIGIGNAGNINLSAGSSLFITNRAAIAANSLGEGNANNIIINVGEALEANNGEIQTDGQSSSGGRINITAKQIRLFGDSNIRTNVFSGAGGGGNINLTADTIIALDDSDILSFARDGKGGDITFNTEGLFSSSQFLPTSAIIANPDVLDLNDRVDVNASGTISGIITGIPDTSFIQDSLRELPENQIDTSNLISQTCIARNNDTGSTFNITGSSGFPHSPGNAGISNYPTSKVRGIPNTTSGKWKKGDPIIEPDGVYRLPDGRFILSHKCF